MGIDSYKSTFRPIQMLTVVPSLLLAISYVIFISVLHIYASEDNKIWSLLYAGISISNYLIQLITVIPSIQNGTTEGLVPLVSGYSNSVFYALMASYFLMCISLLFASFIFIKEDKTQKCIRRLFQCTALAIPLFLIGAIFSITIVVMSGAICWIIGTTIGMFVLSAYVYRIYIRIRKCRS